MKKRISSFEDTARQLRRVRILFELQTVLGLTPTEAERMFEQNPMPDMTIVEALSFIADMAKQNGRLR